VVTEHSRARSRASRVLRCEEKKEYEKLSRQVEGRDRDLSEPTSLSPQQPVDNFRAFTRPMQKPPARIGRIAIRRSIRALLQAGKKIVDEFGSGRRRRRAGDSGKAARFADMTDVSLSRYAEGSFRRRYTGEGYRIFAV